jgi:predicted anti-sigma-YlaC factor YlaD
VGWVFGAGALVLLTVGVVVYRLSGQNDDRQAAAIVSLIVGADLLVFAIDAAVT